MRREETANREKQFLALFKALQLPSSNTKSTNFANRLENFSHDPDSGCTFKKWIFRFEDLVNTAEADMSEKSKSNLLINKLDARSYSLFTDAILPKRATDIDYEEAKRILEKLFGDKVSSFKKRFELFNLVKKSFMPIRTYGGIVNRLCKIAKVDEMSKEDIKCLVFTLGLKAEEDNNTLVKLIPKYRETIKQL